MCDLHIGITLNWLKWKFCLMFPASMIFLGDQILLWYYLFSRCLNFTESRQETIPRGLKFVHAPEREM